MSRLGAGIVGTMASVPLRGLLLLITAMRERRRIENRMRKSK